MMVSPDKTFESALERMPPQNIEAEEAILGGILPNFSPARFEGGPPHLVRPEQWVEGRDCRWQGKFLGSIGPEAFS